MTLVKQSAYTAASADWASISKCWYIYIYIYIYVCVCVCVCVNTAIRYMEKRGRREQLKPTHQQRGRSGGQCGFEWSNLMMWNKRRKREQRNRKYPSLSWFLEIRGSSSRWVSRRNLSGRARQRKRSERCVQNLLAPLELGRSSWIWFGRILSRRMTRGLRGLPLHLWAIPVLQTLKLTFLFFLCLCDTTSPSVQ